MFSNTLQNTRALYEEDSRWLPASRSVELQRRMLTVFNNNTSALLQVCRRLTQPDTMPTAIVNARHRRRVCMNSITNTTTELYSRNIG